jgi:hypothetical protein
MAAFNTTEADVDTFVASIRESAAVSSSPELQSCGFP